MALYSFADVPLRICILTYSSRPYAVGGPLEPNLYLYLCRSARYSMANVTMVDMTLVDL